MSPLKLSEIVISLGNKDTSLSLRNNNEELRDDNDHNRTHRYFARTLK